jgi:hypothetical protein
MRRSRCTARAGRSDHDRPFPDLHQSDARFRACLGEPHPRRRWHCSRSARQIRRSTVLVPPGPPQQIGRTQQQDTFQFAAVSRLGHPLGSRRSGDDVERVFPGSARARPSSIASMVGSRRPRLVPNRPRTSRGPTDARCGVHGPSARHGANAAAARAGAMPNRNQESLPTRTKAAWPSRSRPTIARHLIAVRSASTAMPGGGLSSSLCAAR